MLKIIPSIDIYQGKIVSLAQGDFNQITYYEKNPIDFSLEVSETGFDRLQIIDLDGTKSKKVQNYQILSEIIKNSRLRIQFGGGVKTGEDIEKLYDIGVHQVIIGSLAVNNPKKLLSWLQKYGPEKIILGADVLNGLIRIDGWINQTEFKLHDYLTNYQWHGIKNVICTDIVHDGMSNGASVDFYKQLKKKFPDLRISARGGIRSLDELKALAKVGCYSVIIGRSIQEGILQLKELAAF